MQSLKMVTTDELFVLTLSFQYKHRHHLPTPRICTLDSSLKSSPSGTGSPWSRPGTGTESPAQPGSSGVAGSTDAGGQRSGSGRAGVAPSGRDSGGCDLAETPGAGLRQQRRGGPRLRCARRPRCSRAPGGSDGSAAGSAARGPGRPPHPARSPSPAVGCARSVASRPRWEHRRRPRPAPL